VKSEAGTKVSHILLLEDDTAHQELCLRAFRDDPERFRVSIAGNILKARQIIERDPPDLILADWLLPEGKGLEILPYKDGKVTIPLIIMTSFGDEHLAVEVMKSGAIDYVVKSATAFRDLPHIVRRALRDWENIHERNRAEEAERDSQKRLADILGFLPDAVLAIDNDGRVIAWNDALAKMTGVAAVEMLGKGDHEYSLPFYGERRPTLIDLVRRDDTEIERNYDYIQRDKGKITAETFIPALYGGKGAYLWGTASLLSDAAGKPIGAIEVIRDITDRKRAEETLQKREATLETLLNAPHDTIALLDRQGIIIDINTEGARRLGKTAGEAAGRCAYDLLPPDVAEERKVHIDRVFDTGIPAIFDDERSGMYLHNEIFPVFNPEHTKVDYIAIFARDITGQKRAEQALQESEGKYRFLIDNVRDIIWQTTPDLTFTYVSPVAENLTGYSSQDLTGTSLLGILTESSARAIRERLRKRMEEYSRGNRDLATVFEIEILHKNGSTRWFEVSSNAVIGPGGSLEGFQGISRDITERKQAEKALIESEVRFRDLFNNMGAGVVIYEMTPDGEDFIIRDINRAGETIEQVRKDEIIGKSVLEVFPGVKEFGLFAVFQRVAKSGIAESHPVSLYHDNRISGWRENYVYKLPSGEIVAIYEDVTERKQIEEELQAKEYQLSTIYRNISEVLFFLSVEEHNRYRFLSVNQPFLDITGLTQEQVLGKYVHEVIPEPSLTLVLEKYKQAIQDNTTVTWEEITEYPVGKKYGEVRVTPLIDATGRCTNLVGSVYDITERKRAEDMLRESEEKFRFMVDASPDMIWEIDKQGNFTYISSQCVIQLGYAQEDLIGKSFLTLIQPESAPAIKNRFLAHVQEKSSFNTLEVPANRRDGSPCIIEIRSVPITGNEGQLLGFRGIARDITEQKKTELALRVSEEKARTLMNVPTIGAFIIDSKGILLDANETVLKGYGITAEKILGTSVWNLFSPPMAKRRKSWVEEAIRKKEMVRYEDENEGRYHNVIITPLIDSLGEVPRLAIIAFDITALKKAQESLVESEERLRTIIEQSPSSIQILSPDGRTIQVNRAFEKLWGLTLEDLKDYNILMDEELTRIGIMSYIKRGFSGEAVAIPLVQYDTSPIKGIGQKRWVLGHIYPIRDAAGDIRNIIVTHENVTDREKADNLRRAYEARLDSAMEIGRLAWWEMDLPDGAVRFDDRKAIMLGYSPSQFHQYQDFTALLHPEDYEPSMKAMKDHLEGKVARYNADYRILASDGTYRWLRDVGGITRRHPDGSPATITGIVIDITASKQAEEAVRTTETRFQALIQNSSDIIRILDQHGLIVYESSSAETILGYPPGYMMGKDPFEYIHPEDIERVRMDLRSVYEKKNDGIPTEFRVRKADGEYIWVDSIGVNLLDIAGVNGIVITTRPIQQRKQAEERMLAAQRLYAVQSRINQAIVRVKDLETFAAEICRISVESGRFRMSWIGLIDSESGSIRPIAYAGHEEGYLQSIRIRINGDDESLGPTGTALLEKRYDVCNDIDTDPRMQPWREEALKRGYHSSAAFPFSHHGKVVGAYMIYASGKNFFNETEIALLEEIAVSISFALDMLDEQAGRTKAEKALRENEARLATAMEIAGLVNWEYDVASGMFTFDDRFYALYETTAEREGGNLMPAETYMQEFVYPDDRPAVLASIQKILATTDPDYAGQIEHRITPRDGSVHTIIARFAPIMSPDGKVIRTIGANQDITDLKLMESEIRSLNTVLEQRIKDRTEALSKANEALEEENAQRLETERKLQTSYDEKVLLLKEIHHRVKNNLQIIASLLNLQSRYIKDESTLAAIRESQNRVKAMALVHEKLYRSEDIAKISLQDYIRFLGTGLFQFYDAKSRGIRFTLEVHDVNVDIDSAIPIGLILNELISNSLKYAFPDGRKGEVAISVKKEEHTITILFRDNGIGIPAEMDWRDTPSLGLRLVNTLVDQMNGTVELDRTSGTLFTMVLHEKEPRSPS